VRKSLVNLSVIFSFALINYSKCHGCWGYGCFPIGVIPCKNISVLIFDLVVRVVTEGFPPLLEYLCFRTWYQSAFEDTLPF
jgi:hypothetical protein